MDLRHKVLSGNLADFLQFLSEALTFLKKSKISKRNPDVQHIRSKVEENNHNNHGQRSTYQKYESAFYENAPAIVTLWGFFQTYDNDQLRRYHRLTLTELNGLKGDRHPMSILGLSILGTVALLFTAITVWWGIIKLASGDHPRKFFTELLHYLSSSPMVNSIVGIIWLVGLFVVVWYVVRMVRNRKQVAFLYSLSRALELYLDHVDSQSKRK